MARTHGTRSDLIHCDNCGEEYSSTYKRCPFCGARPSSTQATSRVGGAAGAGRAAQGSSGARSAEEDDYVFDGQDVFDEVDRERGERSRLRGGRHLAGDELDISPTTIIGFVVSGAIVLAAILIVVLVIIPMIKGGQTPSASNDPNGNLPGMSESQTISPSPSSPLPSPSPEPSVEPSDDPEPSVDPQPSDSTPSTPITDPGAGGIKLTYYGSERTEISISDAWPAPVQLQATGASGTVTWKSSDPTVALVSANGLITAVNKGQCYITATDSAGRSQRCLVRSTITVTATEPSSSPAPSPSPSAEPSPSPSQTPSSGTLTLSREDFTLNETWPTYTFTVTGASGAITWSSSNTGVATVDANGKVTRVGKGQCRVTATDAAGQVASCIVRCS